MKPNRSEAVRVVVEALGAVWGAQGKKPDPWSETTTLIGASSAVLDSLGWVMFVVEAEQRVQEQLGVAVSLSGDSSDAKEGATEETIGSLANRICRLAEQAGSAR